MSDISNDPTPRREFLGQLAVSAAALAAAACAPAAMASAPAAAPAPQQGAAPAAPAAPATPPAPVKWDDAWAARITGKHKAVFDSPETGETILGQAYNYYAGMKAVYGIADSEISAVLVMRHAGVPMVFDDYIWEKYEIGKERKIKDDATGKWATRNPYALPDPKQKGMSAYTLDAFNKRGAILIGCNLAAMGLAGQAAQKTKQDRNAVREEFKAHLVPGVTLAHNGIFAVMRAQEAGCGFIRST
jgi:hypothetical protein